MTRHQEEFEMADVVDIGEGLVKVAWVGLGDEEPT